MLKTFRRHVQPRKVFSGGHWFDSATEAKRFNVLRLLTMEKGARIRNLEVHPRLPMVVNGKQIGRGWMTLDFRYEEWVDGAWRVVYEDVKSIDTRESRTRRQVCEAANNIRIKVVQR